MKQLTVGEILDRAKLHLGLTSDNQLANALNWSRQKISVWRKGDIMPRAEELTHLALIARVTPQQVMDAVYRTKMKNFSGKVASWVLVAFLAFFTAQPVKASFDITASNTNNTLSLYTLYALLRAWLARFLLVIA